MNMEAAMEADVQKELQRRRMSWKGAILIEDRVETKVVGRVNFGEVTDPGVIGVGWVQHDGQDRTTTFDSRRWNCAILGDVVVLTRSRSDPVDFDQPHPSALQCFIVFARE